MQPPLGALGLVGGSFRLLLGHFGFLFPLALAPVLAITVLSFVAAPGIADPARLDGLSLAEGAMLLASVVVGFLLGGVLCLAALDAALDMRHSSSEYASQALRHAGPLIVVGTLVSLAIGLGALFVILPGLYIFARFAPYVPAIVFENAGWSGLGRAQTLTEGYRWPLVGAGILIGLAIAAVTVPAIVAATASDSQIVAVLVETLAQSVGYCLGQTFAAVVYLRLREVKDGATRAKIAASVG